MAIQRRVDDYDSLEGDVDGEDRGSSRRNEAVDIAGTVSLKAKQMANPRDSRGEMWELGDLEKTCVEEGLL